MSAGTATAATTTYSVTKTFPASPASDFAGSGGGDGWAVALTPTGVYNVHHHNFTITVACRKQIDASQCWTDPTKTATDATGGTFNTLHPGLHVDQGTGSLYVYATRNADDVGGVVCLDTAVADANPNPFCGFTALTAAGQSSYGYMTNGVSVGDRFYAVNHDNGSGIGAKVLCFDVATVAACAGQPYAADAPGSANGNTISAIGSRLYIPIASNIGCFDTASATECAGSWPVAAPSGYGAPFPLLDASGAAIGVCNPDGTVPCFDLAGSSVATPAGLAAAVSYTQYWNGPSLTIGSRVYVPSGTSDTVICYDYSAAATCPNFPHSLPGANYMYTVNPDPERPTCLWINSDNGAAQIQNFDAFSGGACGEGAIRLLASQFVAPAPECVPTEYSSLQVLDPAPAEYGTGEVEFRDGNGNPIAGVVPAPLDGTGTADITGLNPYTSPGMPQFLITLNDPVDPIGSVTVKVTWTGEDDPDCGGGQPTGQSVSGAKFYDNDTDGVQDAGEVGIADWLIDVTDSSGTQTVITDANGDYTAAAEAGTADVAEQNPAGWIQTGPVGGLYDDVAVGEGQNVTGLDFGNVCVGAGGGHTRGFWQNRNGQRVFNTDSAGALAMLTALNLRSEAGGPFDPTTYAQFRNWLRDARAGKNAAYMLSAQLAAMALNVHFGFVDPSIYIQAGGADAANAAGFATVQDVMDEADALLAADGSTPPEDEPNRSDQLLLSGILDAANNNRSFVQDGPDGCTDPFFALSFSDDFNSENGGTGDALNYTGFANWDVSDGTVDIIGIGGSFDLHPGNGLYVDLDGSTGDSGVFETDAAFALLDGGTYRLTFDLGGSQRGTNESVTVTLGSVYTETFAVSAADPLSTVTRDIVITASELATLMFENLGGDNIGAILDNVTLNRIA